MSNDVLTDVTVKFEKAFKGDDVRVAKKGVSKTGQSWKLYEFNASFKDETGQTKKHKMKSFTLPGAPGTTVVGTVELYHGDGPKGPYISYTLTPNEEQVPQGAPEKSSPAADESHDSSAERAAIRRYVNFVWSVCTNNGERSDEVAAAIFPGVRMMVGDYTKTYEAYLKEAEAETTEEKDNGVGESDDIPF